MRQRYLHAGLLTCASFTENEPNSAYRSRSRNAAAITHQAASASPGLRRSAVAAASAAILAGKHRRSGLLCQTASFTSTRSLWSASTMTPTAIPPARLTSQRDEKNQVHKCEPDFLILILIYFLSPDMLCR